MITRRQVKRLGHPNNVESVRKKVRREERMSKQLRGLHLSESRPSDERFFMKKPYETFEEMELRIIDSDSDEDEEKDDEGLLTSKRDVVLLSDELKDVLKSKSSHIFRNSVPEMEIPCTDVVLWKPLNLLKYSEDGQKVEEASSSGEEEDEIKVPMPIPKVPQPEYAMSMVLNNHRISKFSSPDPVGAHDIISNQESDAMELDT
ncbi:unnamed protein product [Soboliphyme baturini]|uniref:Snurportin-1 n=1 Tax=Soboliphyme baturini TaxID=241478 RepID=A0A183IJT3_9BILA|nr:unnamed protein product [Soboliphyme baturini]